MLERHVQEPALVAVERAILAGVDGGLRRRERLRIAGERARRVAERVARELVEQEDARERAAWCRRPVAVSACERRLDRRAEARTDLGVERGILAEPGGARSVRRGAEPEREDLVLRERGGHHAMHQRSIVTPCQKAT